MGDVLQLGIRVQDTPLPPIAMHTTYVLAGPLSIGVEYRVLTDQLIDDAKGVESDRLKGFASQGSTLHVCDAADGTEYLRFDCFDGDPHYHYITPGEAQLIVVYDRASCGDMWTWALGCLRDRLPEMLRQAGATSLAERVEPDAVLAAIPEIERLAATGHAAGPVSLGADSAES
ncbi:MAG TPA: hypothetical protein VNV87_01640 [Acidimicrobiales bacterium]|jgi:hypothetical protein|nr:hypothetical protein [Acidimicrobiales bacterium]